MRELREHATVAALGAGFVFALWVALAISRWHC